MAVKQPAGPKDADRPLDPKDAEDPERFDTPAWTAALRTRHGVTLLGPRVLACADRVRSLQRHMHAHLYGREREARLLLIAAIAQAPILLLGPPGVGKSALVHRMADGLGLRGGDRAGYFEYLLTEFTEPNEVLGPVNLKRLQDEGVFERNFAGLLADSRLAFLDEIFKANSAILNVLLTIINERIVYVSGRPRRVPLEVLVGAANEVPHAGELAALYDRFPLRVRFAPVIESVDSARDVLTYAQRAEAEEVQRAGTPAGSAVPRVACLNDILALSVAARAAFDVGAMQGVPVFERFLARCLHVKRELDDLVSLSDRKIVRLWRVVCAGAMLDGRKAPDESDLAVFEHVGEDAGSESSERIRQVLAAPGA